MSTRAAWGSSEHGGPRGGGLQTWADPRRWGREPWLSDGTDVSRRDFCHVLLVSTSHQPSPDSRS